jgi:hypothetical protein
MVMENQAKPTGQWLRKGVASQSHYLFTFVSLIPLENERKRISLPTSL